LTFACAKVKNMEPPTIKVIIVGDSTCGKTSLLKRLTENEYKTNEKATLGVDFYIRIFYHSHTKQRIKLVMWDTAGQERFASLVASYYRGSQVMLFVFDLTRKETFASLNERWMKHASWMPDAHGSYGTVQKETIAFLIGNKMDLSDSNRRQVTREEATTFAETHGMHAYFEMSAATGQNVQEHFQELVDYLFETGKSPHTYGQDGSSGSDDGGGGGRVPLSAELSEVEQDITLKRKNCC
jgi:Ras-related protein Rab-18